MTGVTPAGPGLRPTGGAAKASPAEPLVPNAEERLLPCPFCGCPNLEYDIIAIDCPNCFACGPPRRAIGEDGVLTSDGQWNARGPASAYRQGRVRELNDVIRWLVRSDGPRRYLGILHGLQRGEHCGASGMEARRAASEAAVHDSPTGAAGDAPKGPS